MSITDERPAAEAVCKNAATVNLPFSQTIIFPGNDRPIEENIFVISMREVAKSRQDWVSEQYAGRNLLLDEAKADAIRKEQLAQPLYGTFTVVGCITYFYRNGNATDQTGFILDVYRPCAESPVGECAFNMGHPATYNQEDILVRESHRGLFAK